MSTAWTPITDAEDAWPDVALEPSGSGWVVRAHAEEIQACPVRDFQPGRWLTVHPHSSRQQTPTVACLPDGAAAVAWARERHAGRRQMVASVGGESGWAEPVVLDEAPDVIAPQAVTDRMGRVWIAWVHAGRHEQSIMTATYAEGRWRSAEGVSEWFEQPGRPSIAACGDEVVVAFDNFANGAYSVAVCSLPQEHGWHATPLNAEPGGHRSPRTAFDAAGRAWIAWREELSGAVLVRAARRDPDGWCRIGDGPKGEVAGLPSLEASSDLMLLPTGDGTMWLLVERPNGTLCGRRIEEGGCGDLAVLHEGGHGYRIPRGWTAEGNRFGVLAIPDMHPDQWCFGRLRMG